MEVILNVSVDELEKKVNRQIKVDEDISLIDFCESIIVSMNGSKIPLYVLELEKSKYYPYEFVESSVEKSLVGLSFKDLKLEKGSNFCLFYNFDNPYVFDITVDWIMENNADEEHSSFEVMSGSGYGILDSESAFYLCGLFAAKRKDNYSYYPVSIRNYLQATFDYVENNHKIQEYMKHRKELVIPKRYILNVSLEGFEKEIKRKISINSNVSIEEFCKGVIISMNGDLSHGFGLKFKKEFLSESYYNFELYYLDLTEKQRFKMIYDWGDNWVFCLSVSKIIDDYSDLDIDVLSGKGYGIIDDSGGAWTLGNIFAGQDTSWGKYNIHDFDLDECNRKIHNFSKENSDESSV